MITSSLILSAIIGHFWLAFLTQPVVADENQFQVKACSAIMKDDCATGRVRHTATGKQVQLPSGNWTDCGSDCSRKLRKMTVDFWQEQMLQN